MKANIMSSDMGTAWTLIWHGCEVRQLASTCQHGIRLELAVASVSAPDGTQGYLKGVLLNWPQATWQTDVPLQDILGGVADGHWLIEEAMHKTMVIPCTCVTPHTLSLRLLSGTELCVQGHECQITVAPDAPFQESMAC